MGVKFGLKIPNRLEKNVRSPRLAQISLPWQQGSDCLSVCLFVTLLLQIDSSFLFLDGIEPAMFLAVISPCGTLQNAVLRFLI